MLAQDAVNLLISRIEQQASHDNVALSDLERKMLRWSEIEPDGLCDGELNDRFESEYDSDEYETKISGLLKRAYQRDSSNPDRESEWDDIRRALEGHDYYLIVLLAQAFQTTGSAAIITRKSSLRDNVIYLAIALAIVAVVAFFVSRQR